MNKKAHTLLEIIVTVVILSLVVGGLVATFISGKRWIMHSRLRVAGGEIGKYFLDPLALEVRQDEWDETAHNYNNSLKTTSSPQAGTAVPINDRTYTPVYTISTITGLDEEARKVKVEIRWVE